MTQTLRRELLKTIKNIVKTAVDDDEWVNELSEKIADGVLELRAFKQKPAFDQKQADPVWALFHGGSIEQDQVDRAKLEEEAFADFERNMQLPDSWHWYSSGTDEKALKVLREHVVKEYTKDKLIFQKYQTWRISPFARGAMSNLAIKRNPENFVYSWSDFLASYATNAKNLPTGKVETDDNDIPITY